MTAAKADVMGNASLGDAVTYLGCLSSNLKPEILDAAIQISTNMMKIAKQGRIDLRGRTVNIRE